MTHRPAAAMVVLLILSGGCAARHGRPLAGGSPVANPTGTISGTVRSTGGTPLEGRRVSAINVSTQAHFDTMTEKNGGYTIKVPPGRYRLEVELRGGDQLASQPDPFNVNVSDLDAQKDLVVGR